MKPERVSVEWLDARDWASSTLTLEEVPSRVSLRLRHSEGWLVYVGPDPIHRYDIHVLAVTFDPAQEADDKPEYGDFTVIPSGWVKAVHYLQRRRAKRAKAVSDGSTKEGTTGGAQGRGEPTGG